MCPPLDAVEWSLAVFWRTFAIAGAAKCCTIEDRRTTDLRPGRPRSVAHTPNRHTNPPMSRWPGGVYHGAHLPRRQSEHKTTTATSASSVRSSAGTRSRTDRNWCLISGRRSTKPSSRRRRSRWRRPTAAIRRPSATQPTSNMATMTTTIGQISAGFTHRDGHLLSTVHHHLTPHSRWWHLAVSLSNHEFRHRHAWHSCVGNRPTTHRVPAATRNRKQFVAARRRRPEWCPFHESTWRRCAVSSGVGRQSLLTSST